MLQYKAWFCRWTVYEPLSFMFLKKWGKIEQHIVNTKSYIFNAFWCECTKIYRHIFKMLVIVMITNRIYGNGHRATVETIFLWHVTQSINLNTRCVFFLRYVSMKNVFLFFIFVVKTMLGHFHHYLIIESRSTWSCDCFLFNYKLIHHIHFIVTWYTSLATIFRTLNQSPNTQCL